MKDIRLTLRWRLVGWLADRAKVPEFCILPRWIQIIQLILFPSMIGLTFCRIIWSRPCVQFPMLGTVKIDVFLLNKLLRPNSRVWFRCVGVENGVPVIESKIEEEE